MDFIDEEGRLFGYVNIIDALVVLLILAVLVAGVALVSSSSSSDPQPSQQSNYVTLTFGSVSHDTLQPIVAAEKFSLVDDGPTYNVTDTYVTAHPTRDTAVVKKRVKRPVSGGLLTLDGENNFQTGSYVLNASIGHPGASPTIATGTTRVLLDTNVSPQIGTAIEEGDTYRIGNTTVASIVSKEAIGRANGKRHLLVGLQLQTSHHNGSPSYANRKVVLDSTLPFRAGTYSFSGTVRERNVAEVPTKERRVQVETTVSQSTASAIEPGQTIDADGESVATIEAVRSYPTGNPDQRRLQLGLTLRTVHLDGESTYMGHPVRIGSTIPLATNNARFGARIIGLVEESRTETDATLEVQWENVDPEVADALFVGLLEQHRGASASIIGLETEPATVILQSESGEIFAREHPINVDVNIRVAVTGRQTNEGFVFHGRPIQEGSKVVLDFGTVTVQGTVTDVETDG